MGNTTRKMKILLIEPDNGVWLPGKYLRHSSVEPLGLEYIGAMVLKEGNDVKIVQQRHTSDDKIIEIVNIYKPDIVGFSVMTYNFNAAKILAERIKIINHKIIIVFGGSHPTTMPEIVKDENIDFVVIGEGEETFRELVKKIEEKREYYKIKGIAYFDKELKITEPRPRITELDSIPWPIRKKELINDCKIYGLNNPPLSNQKSVVQILYSRGCPYNCIFCCSHYMWGSKVIFRSANDVVKEIKYLEDNFGTNYIYFNDLTFNCNKHKVLDLCKEMKKQKILSKWFCLCTVNNIDKEIIQAMSEAGCTRIGFGVDSVNNDVLSKMKPLQKTNLEITANALAISDEAGIINRAFIIIGDPEETIETLQSTEKIINQLPIDELRIGIFTPLPGSPIYKEYIENNLIINNDFSKYTTEECVIKLKYITIKELIEFRNSMFNGFYESKEYQNRIKSKMSRFPHLKISYREFKEFLNKNNIVISI